MGATRLLLLIPILTLLSANVSGEELLPRVLLLGDVVYQEPAKEAAKELAGKVEIVFTPIQPGEVRNTTTALENLDHLLGKGKWDLIHFNFGLGDLIYRAPNMKSFRVLPIEAGGGHTTSPEQYENNLRDLTKRLKATGAKLVWASTTPIRHSSTNVFELGSEIKYNAIAAKVMTQEQVAINDMCGQVKLLINMTKPASHGADPFDFDKKPLHPLIVQSILKELELISVPN